MDEIWPGKPRTGESSRHEIAEGLRPQVPQNLTQENHLRGHFRGRPELRRFWDSRWRLPLSRAAPLLHPPEQPSASREPAGYARARGSWVSEVGHSIRFFLPAKFPHIKGTPGFPALANRYFYNRALELARRTLGPYVICIGLMPQQAKQPRWGRSKHLLARA